MAAWGTPVEVERRRRILLAVAAYAYEILNVSLMSDADFDEESLRVDLSIDTGNKRMDLWFRRNFQPHTGMWIRKHPDMAGLHRIATEISEAA